MTGRRHVVGLGLVMTLAAGLAALLFAPLREAIGIDQPSDRAFAQARALFLKALENGGEGALAEDLADLSLVLAAPEDDWPGFVLREPLGDCRGRGVYSIRQGQAAPLALTAPHRGSDRHTGTLAAQLFAEIDAKATAWNSAPRSPSETCPHAVDLAREERHMFTAFSLAFVEAFPTGTVVQLHGFDRAKRGDIALRQVDVIVSNGTMEPSAAVLDLADCLAIQLAPRAVRVFPIDAAELGALSNAQGLALRQAGFEGFVHLELSEALRVELVNDPALRTRLAACLQGAAA